MSAFELTRRAALVAFVALAGSPAVAARRAARAVWAPSAASGSTSLPCWQTPANRPPVGWRRRFRPRSRKLSPPRAGAGRRCRCASTTSCSDRTAAARAPRARPRTRWSAS